MRLPLSWLGVPGWLVWLECGAGDVQVWRSCIRKIEAITCGKSRCTAKVPPRFLNGTSLVDSWISVVVSTSLLISTSVSSFASQVMPPRPLRPKDEPGVSEDQDTSSEGNLNKRKAVSSACIPCRKRKSKVSLA